MAAGQKRDMHVIQLVLCVRARAVRQTDLDSTPALLFTSQAALSMVPNYWARASLLANGYIMAKLGMLGT